MSETRRDNSGHTVEKQLEAGRELNIAVAERVIGITVKYASGTPYDPSQLAPWVNPERDLIMDGSWARAQIPPYSEGIAAAMLVVEAMRARGCWLDLNYMTDSTDRSRSSAVAGFFREGARGCVGSAGAETAPLAICLAALRALAAHPPDQRPSLGEPPR
jgi:hypothetical protein